MTKLKKTFWVLAALTFSSYVFALTDICVVDGSVDKSNWFHHHIHNFYFNDSDSSKSNYLALQRHAIAMQYESTTHYLAKKLPGNIDKLKRILLHNAYYIPMTIDFGAKQVKYTVSYLNESNKSTVNSNRQVWSSYSIDNSDIELLKVYGCAKSDQYTDINVNSYQNDVENAYRINKNYQRFIVNWQSKYVVDELYDKTMTSLRSGNYDYLFIDDLPRNPDNCLNKNAGGKGFYSTWKAGQLAFLQKVTNGAHSLLGRSGNQVKVFGNIWSPYADFQTAIWYESKELRLDHYYFESGGTAREDILNGQSTNSIDPETGLPAFRPIRGGYLPAKLVSVGTHIETMYKLIEDPSSNSTKKDYLKQHYRAAGDGAVQGSWFGWYGETSVDALDSNGNLVHSNLMQLLRVIPNWDNLANIPISARKYNQSNNSYTSPNSLFSDSVIKSRNPLNNQLYVIFTTKNGEVELGDYEIKTAMFVDDFFNVSTNALSCLSVNKHKLTLKCQDKLGVGIRIITD